jgi:hypothetical protein
MGIVKIDKEFLLEDGHEFSVSNPAGVHFTYKIRCKEIEGRTNHFVSYIEINERKAKYRYLGALEESGKVRLTHASPCNDEKAALAFSVLQWAVKVVFTNSAVPEGYLILPIEICRVCNRRLKDPTSLLLGIGPECRKKKESV